ncbi:tyrosine-type recombinase/integrase [Candidatus Bipolaricaulota bacterium]|nr:tyrosine-type recombinase/integrase [Candidatus Bipolaricaulota bacterium]
MTRRKKLPVVLSEDERKQLLGQPNPRYPTGERNLAMIHLMLNVGLRLSEATALRWNDLDLLTGKLLVKEGKGAKDRSLWLGEADIDRLRAWKTRQVSLCRAEHVFSTLKGTRISNRYVQAMVARYVKRAGIHKRVSPHTLRHTFATDLYAQTLKIRLVQKVLGHSDLSTTMIYTHVFDPEVEDALKSFRQPEAVAV